MKWKEDSAETEVIVYLNDLSSGIYEPSKIVKDDE